MKENLRTPQHINDPAVPPTPSIIYSSPPEGMDPQTTATLVILNLGGAYVQDKCDAERRIST
jgi:hypothetical protein